MGLAEVVCRGEGNSTANMFFMIATLDVSEKCSGWLNASVFLNIQPMFVTLDVLKPSGWLNAFVSCRVGRGRDVGQRLKGVGRWWREQRAKRTKNMSLMVVTLDVSRFSGWLNVDAF